ncbi:MAG TPA: MATE family efflux transporter [Pseudomonas sp.]|uniref:MATE family efflux transporter n=1 Tax=Pseudomonas sp. TaxID=306 RepID=UPI002ED92456
MSTPATGHKRHEFRALLALAVPLAAAQIGQMAMAVTTGIQLGHVGSLALAAGGLGASITSVLVLVSQGVLAGIQPIIAQARGRADEHTQQAYAGALWAALALALIASLLVVPLLLNLTPLLELMGVETDVAALTASYCRNFAWGVPAILAYAPLRYYLAALEQIRVILLLAFAGAAVNALLGWMLIFGTPYWTGLGVAGGGLALSTTWWCMLLALVWYCQVHRRLPQLRFLSWPTLVRNTQEVFAVGWPIGGLYAAEIGLVTLATLQVARLGPVELGAHLICMNIVNIIFMVPLALSQAATIRVATFIGLNQPWAVRRSGWSALMLAGLFMVLSGLLITWQEQRIVTLFLPSDDANFAAILELNHSLFLILALYFVFDGIQTVATGALRGLKDTRAPMLICLCGYWGLAFPVGLFLARGLGWGAAGFWCGYAVGLAVVAALLTLRWHHTTHSFHARSGAMPLHLTPGGL